MQASVVDYKNGDSEFWKGQVACWEQTDTTQAEYCRQKNLNLSTFGYWKRKISAPTVAKFVEVHVKENIPLPGSSSIKVLIGDDLAIEVGDGFNPDSLRKVVMAVRSLPCG
jgi:hypothetical protein